MAFKRLALPALMILALLATTSPANAEMEIEEITEIIEIDEAGAKTPAAGAEEIETIVIPEPTKAVAEKPVAKKATKPEVKKTAAPKKTPEKKVATVKETPKKKAQPKKAEPRKRIAKDERPVVVEETVAVVETPNAEIVEEEVAAYDVETGKPATLDTRTRCRMAFNLKGWSAFYKRAKGKGTITCDNGQTANVTLSSVGGGITFGKHEITDGEGKFTKVEDINQLFGSYATSEAHAGASRSADAQAMTKGKVSLTFTGTGKGYDLGFSFGRLRIKPAGEKLKAARAEKKK